MSDLQSALPSRDALMEKARHENFPVATLLLGRRYRSHLLAIYGFARLVDDIGDEAPGDRLAMLDQIEQELACVCGGGPPAHPIMRALAPTIAELGLPGDPFGRLIEANRQDQVITRYETFEELLGYCQLSAAPVGELVLRVFGAATEARIALSDRVCAGLQILEHLLDVGEDYACDRVYLPQDDLARFGCDESVLGEAVASPPLRRLIAALALRTRGLLAAGAPLSRQLSPRPRLALAGFRAGAGATLTALEQADYDILGRCPRRTARGFAAALPGALMGR